MNKIGIIYCPRHKWFFHSNSWKDIEPLLKSNEIDYSLITSDRRESVERITKTLINNGYKTIILVGGDSALRSATQALMDTDQNRRDEIAIGLIPNGIENDFAKFWNLYYGQYTEAVKAIKRRRIRKVDVGHITYTDRNGNIRRHYFLGSVNIGLIARQMNMLRFWKHKIGSRHLSYLATMITCLFHRMEYKMHIQINETDQTRQLMSASIGNTSCYGLTPSASPYDGMLDVSLIHHPRLRQIIECFSLLKSQKVLNMKSVSPYRTFYLNFPESPRCDIVVDGDEFSMPRQGFSIKIEKEMINFIMPL